MCGATRRRYCGAPAPPVNHVYNMHALKTCARHGVPPSAISFGPALEIVRRYALATTVRPRLLGPLRYEHDAVSSLVRYNYPIILVLESIIR